MGDSAIFLDGGAPSFLCIYAASRPEGSRLLLIFLRILQGVSVELPDLFRETATERTTFVLEALEVHPAFDPAPAPQSQTSTGVCIWGKYC